MAQKGFTRKFRPLEILTEGQVEEIHRGTLYILEHTGVVFLHEEVLKLLKNNGCHVDFGNNRVKFPPALVEECIRRCPSSYLIRARDPKHDLIIGGNTSYFTPQVGKDIADQNTWETRTPTRKENYEFVKVMDGLECLHTQWLYCPFFGFEGVPPVMGIPESVAGMFRNSTKIPASGYQTDCEIFTTKMAKAIGSDVLGICVCANPLTYYRDACLAARLYEGKYLARRHLLCRQYVRLHQRRLRLCHLQGSAGVCLQPTQDGGGRDADGERRAVRRSGHCE